MGLQTRDVIRFARKNGLRLARYGLSTREGKDVPHCAVGLVAHMADVHNPWDEGAPRLGLTNDDLYALEAGFEGWYGDKNNRYYKVGQNIAATAGIGI